MRINILTRYQKNGSLKNMPDLLTPRLIALTGTRSLPRLVVYLGGPEQRQRSCARYRARVLAMRQPMRVDHLSHRGNADSVQLTDSELHRRMPAAYRLLFDGGGKRVGVDHNLMLTSDNLCLVGSNFCWSRLNHNVSCGDHRIRCNAFRLISLNRHAWCRVFSMYCGGNAQEKHKNR